MKHLGLLVALVAICKSTLALNYCVPVPTNGVNNYKLTHVGMLDIDTNLNVNSTYLLVPDTTFNVTGYMRPGYLYTLDLSVGGFTNRTVAAWIDWNRDTTFSSSEKLGEFVSNGISSISFQVPLNCAFGKLRLRVRVSNGTSIDACSNYSSGQTIDFTITTMNPRFHDDFDYNFYRTCNGRYIDEVHLANLNNVNTGSEQGPIFNDYTYMSANVQCCTLYNLVIASQSNVSGEHLSVFIDLNDNGSFADMNEFVTDGYVIIGTNIDTLPLTIPFTSGSRRMRINLGDEYEDYMVNINSSNTPDTPDAHIGHFLHDESANPIWSCAGPVTFYDWSCGVSSSRTWQINGPSNFTSNNQNPTFNLPLGAYTVILTVSNSFGSDADTAYLNVTGPVATMGSLGNDTVICSGTSLDLYPPWIDDGSGGANCSYSTWSTGVISPSITVDTAGTYMVIVEDCGFEGCPTYDTISVQFSTNNYSVTGGGGICPGAGGVAVGLSDSQNGIGYQLKLNGNPVGNPLFGNGAAISFGLQTVAGTYTVEADDTILGCVNDMTGSATVIVRPVPSQYSVTGGGTICLGSPGASVGLSNSQTGVSYQLKRNGTSTGNPVMGNNSVINFGAQALAGTYSVLATDTSAGCTANMTGTVSVIVAPGPTQYSVTGGGTICQGSAGVSVGLSNSQTGISYQLKRNGVPTGTAVNGNGSAITFGAQTTAGTYSVGATDITLGCTVNMNGSAVVVVNPKPNIYNVTGGGHYCAGSSAPGISLSNSQSGVNYLLLLNGVSTGITVAGNNSLINFPIQTAAGTYTVVGTNATTSCSVSMQGSQQITVDALPSVYNLTGGGSYCNGVGVQLTLSNSTSGVNYELFNNNVSTGVIIAGTGSAIHFQNLQAGGTYKVVATNSSNCSATMNGSPVITSSSPTIYNLTGGGSYCSGAGIQLTLSNSTSGITYELFRNNVATGTIINGTGAAINYQNLQTAGTYTVVATNSSSCTATMNGSSVISIAAAPAQFAFTGDANYCQGQPGADVSLAGSEINVSYRLFINSVASGLAVQGTGDTLSFGIHNTIGNYTVIATSAGNCSALLTDTISVNMYTSPSTIPLSTGGNYCPNSSGAEIYLNTSLAGNDYQLMYGGIPQGQPVVGTGSQISFGYYLNSGVYDVTVTENVHGCTATRSDTLTLIMDSVQQAQIDPLPSIVCIFDAPISLSGTPADGVFTVDTSVTSVFEPALLGSGNHWITYVYTDTANGCSSTASDTIYVDICTGVKQIPVSNAITVYPNPASDHVTIDFAEQLDKEITLELFSTYGQLIKRYSDIKCNPDCRFTISLENLSNGIYWLRVLDSNKLIRNVSIIKNE